ncbi:unnamed protein product [Heligmosomoides polygyrus]|uniref:Reverse transcriptase domain-containing protein n=1 Tax=Heligmosomoides polygyrus TaxID=6339 RepID=A0A183FQT4_HELPZ|nr:unnamed protein product [Heligmosomoides polygyrus]
MNVYERLVDSRLRKMVPSSQKQWDFVLERFIAIFVGRQVMEEYREKRKPCYIAYLELQKDSNGYLWPYSEKLSEREVSQSDHGHKGHVRRLTSCDANSTGSDENGGTVEVHTGSASSPFLFLLTLDCKVNRLGDGLLRTILYADTITLVAESQEKLEDNVQLWQRAVWGNGLLLKGEEDDIHQL